MRCFKSLAVTALLTIIAAPLAAGEIKVYPYKSSANYCPAGLQPVSVIGVISCGTPNVTVSYQQVKAHPVSRRNRTRAHLYNQNCPIGTKGCTYD